MSIFRNSAEADAWASVTAEQAKTSMNGAKTRATRVIKLVLARPKPRQIKFRDSSLKTMSNFSIGDRFTYSLANHNYDS